MLPSAKDFGDCLHQARAAEEQERQLKEIHQSRSTEVSRSLESTAKTTRETPRTKSTDVSSSSRRYQ